MGLAVILHRLPVGLALWYLVAPHFGVRAALAVLLLMCVATALGFNLGPAWTAALDGAPLAWFQAFVAGSILHVIVYEPAHHQAPTAVVARWPDRLGLLVGLALLYIYL
jgi:zinc transporter ZupT